MLERRFHIFAAMALLLLGLASCKPQEPLAVRASHYDKVAVYYISGYNNLASALSTNLDSFVEDKSYLPEIDGDNALVVLSHLAYSVRDYETPTSPCLIHIYRRGGQAIRDTLVAYEPGTPVSNPEMLGTVMNDVKRLFPADSYGMIFSSHGTGFLPEGYYTKGEESLGGEAMRMRQSSSGPSAGYLKYGVERPLVKSVGAHYHGSYLNSEELEIKDFADALPYKLDYLIFDACLMGGAEVAYEFRDKVDCLIASQAEIAATGMYYPTMLERIFGGQQYDLEGICRDYYDFYYNDPIYGGTISLIDCNRMEPLAETMKAFFEAHRDNLSAARSSAQRYSRSADDFYYDLRDFARHAGATDEELSEIDAALSQCVLCHYATTYFMSIRLLNCCGLSSYIPTAAYPKLNEFYKTLEWNKTTGMVE